MHTVTTKNLAKLPTKKKKKKNLKIHQPLGTHTMTLRGFKKFFEVIDADISN